MKISMMADAETCDFWPLEEGSCSTCSSAVLEGLGTLSSDASEPQKGG